MSQTQIRKLQKKLTRKVENFYLESIELHRRDEHDSIKDIYLKTCNEIIQIIPTTYTFDKKLDIEQLRNNLSNIIVITNHIQTPYLAVIKSLPLYRKLKVSVKDLPHKKIMPWIIRHAPITSFLNKLGFNTHFVSGKRAGLLGDFSLAWGGIQIAGNIGTNRLAKIEKNIDNLGDKKNAIIMFPSGMDMQNSPGQTLTLTHPYKRGFAVISRKKDLPILPISMAFDWKKGEYHIHIHRIYTQEELINKTIEEQPQFFQDLIEKEINRMVPETNTKRLKY